MKISIVAGFFLPVPPVAGGAMEKIWFRLAREFAARGHHVTHFSRQWPGFSERETIDGVEWIRLRGYQHTSRLVVNLGLDFLWGMRVLRHLPKADIVACNTVSLPVHLSFFRPQAGRVAVVLGRMPKGHAHFYGRVDRLVATSEAVREEIVRERPRLKERTRVFPNPIDWKLHQLPRGTSSAFEIGYVGRINPEKGIELLIAAAAVLKRRAGLPAWRVRLVGPQRISEGGGGDTYVENLRRLAVESGADIQFAPPVFDPEALAQVYAGFDAFCYPSLAEKGEGLSVAPLEAMSAGAVPVLSRLDCYRDVISEEVNGCTFDHRSPDAAIQLADCLAGLMGDPSRLARLSAAARRDARRFDYEVVAEGLLADFAELAGGNRK